METDWEGDWENTEPDLLVSIKNKERELKLLEERRMMEDIELALTEELFNPEQENIDKSKHLESFVPVNFIKKEKSKKIHILQDKQKQTKTKL